MNASIHSLFPNNFTISTFLLLTNEKIVLQIYAGMENTASSSSSVDSLTSLHNLHYDKNIKSDVIMSETEDEAMPLNSVIPSQPFRSYISSEVSESETPGTNATLLGSEYLPVKEIQSPTKRMDVKRANSVKRDPPKVLVNRVPPAGIGKLNNEQL